MYDKVVPLGSRLHYPITITKLLKSPGDKIKKQESIVEYKFSWRRKVNDDTWTDETTYTEFDSPAEGVLKEWRIKEGMVINADAPCMMVEESCGHEVQIQGLCSLCGADMTEINWATEERDTDRAMINMTHDQTGLMVSENVAKKAEHDTQKRLLRQRKLSLVVDLDQTIIHACIEPTVGEWQRDPTNPNHDAVKHVRAFQLNDDGPRGLASGCTYYIKLRPGLAEFLEEIATMYELHVYTMGTRAYALNIAKIVDPDKKLFGNRVISRDENGSITSKSLQRLFPVSTDMVVIIDDRADVWPMNRANLIKVVPYDFFKGIGDINSSFLPKRQDILPAPPKTNGKVPDDKPEVQPKPPAPDPNAPKASPLEELVKITGADNAETIKIQTKEQEKTLEKQLTDRPLLHMQEELDKEDESQEVDVGDSSGGHHRQHLLNDDDEELIALQDHLTDLHTAFYDLYDKRRKERREAVPIHPPGHKARRRPSVDDGVDLSMVPDAGDILYSLKSNVLSGLVIAMSGLVPMGTAVADSEIGMQAQSFGARVFNKVGKTVTHLVVSSSRLRTRKVQKAIKKPNIRIVNQNWLLDCLSQWRRLDEGPYLVKISEKDKAEDANSQMSEADSEDEEEGKGLNDIDWGAAQQEILDMMSEGDDDFDNSMTESGNNSDTESIDAGDSRGKGTKRKHDADGDDTDDDNTSIASESVLAKKQRVARSRGASSLRSVRTPNGAADEDDDAEEETTASQENNNNTDKNPSLPTPGPTGDEVDMEDTQTQTDFDDDMEKDLLAAFGEAEGDD